MNRFSLNIIIVLFMLLGISLFVKTVEKCGFITTMMLGNGAWYAAENGMCDK